ncbi:MAG: aspartyl-phosphate phosphatase Spo0E family protein [Peptostreptococcaceae bacterium]|nr:aspartyl-phosphate phosphatase Spo0E family protein [Peptostreptococcaceae bacterium]
MNKNALDSKKELIEEKRMELNRYLEYPQIFEKEIHELSREMDALISEYMINED